MLLATNSTCEEKKKKKSDGPVFNVCFEEASPFFFKCLLWALFQADVK